MLGLAAGEHVAHLADTHRGFGLQGRQRGDLRGGGLGVTPAHGANRYDSERDQRRDDKEDGDRCARQHEGGVGHGGPNLRDSDHKNKK